MQTIASSSGRTHTEAFNNASSRRHLRTLSSESEAKLNATGNNNFSATHKSSLRQTAGREERLSIDEEIRPIIERIESLK
jgi:hypothetical protein